MGVQPGADALLQVLQRLRAALVGVRGPQPAAVGLVGAVGVGAAAVVEVVAVAVGHVHGGRGPAGGRAGGRGVLAAPIPAKRFLR